MELRSEEHDPQAQCHKADTLTVAKHLLIKTKLRMDWLQGQVNYPAEVRILRTRVSTAFERGARLRCGVMKKEGSIFVRSDRRAAFAMLACAALLFFAACGSLLHEHSHGPDTTCHLCQALHMPALAAARLSFAPVLETLAWYSSRPQHFVLSEPFSLHRASRAPPIV